MTLEIKHIDKQTYADFCRETGEVFNSVDWLDLFPSNLILCGVFDNGTRLLSVFYHYKDVFYGIPYYHCPPFTPHNGLIIKTESENFSLINFEIKKISTCISKYYNQLSKYGIVKIAFPIKHIDFQPFIWDKFKVIPNYTYQIALSQSIDEISKKMTSERRHNFKKAIKDGITCKICSNHSITKELVLQTFKRQSLNIDIQLLDKIFFQFTNSRNSFSFVSYKNEVPISTVFCVYEKDIAYYLLGGYDDKNFHTSAGAFAMWNAIQHSKVLGLKTFDFEGSMIIPVEKYFRGFGGNITPYFTINKANLFLEICLKFLKRETF